MVGFGWDIIAILERGVVPAPRGERERRECFLFLFSFLLGNLNRKNYDQNSKVKKERIFFIVKRKITRDKHF